MGDTSDGGGLASRAGAARVVGHLGVAVELLLAGGVTERHRVARNADIVVGDRVTVRDGRVHVDDRTTVLVRRAAHGGRAQILAANVDTLFILVARDPPPRVHLVDRAAVMARASGITPHVIVTKLDLEGTRGFADALRETYAGSVSVSALSSATGEGVRELESSIPAGNTVVFLGPSGAGKSTLTNALCPGASLATAALSDATGRGRHTTSKATLTPAPRGFFVVDLPGIRDFGFTGLAREDLAACFPGFERVDEGCRYRDCLHRGEPGCAVLAAVQAGLVREERHAAYRLLLDELA